MKIEKQLHLYYTGTIIGVIFAVIGFSYNAWRLEVTEDNNNIRIASFAVLKELAELEQLIYAGHYDKNTVAGSPRRGWIKVGLVVDLSSLISPPVRDQALSLKASWQSNWQKFTDDQAATDTLITSIDAVRNTLKTTLVELQ
jgi:hypothetical protein